VATTDPWITAEAAREQLGVADSTWRTWRRDGRGPQCRRLPNGELRLRQSTLDTFMDALDLV
jgi:predicted site-specific integrase-resolvase